MQSLRGRWTLLIHPGKIILTQRRRGLAKILFRRLSSGPVAVAEVRCRCRSANPQSRNRSEVRVMKSEGRVIRSEVRECVAHSASLPGGATAPSAGSPWQRSRTAGRKKVSSRLWLPVKRTRSASPLRLCVRIKLRRIRTLAQSCNLSEVDGRCSSTPGK